MWCTVHGTVRMVPLAIDPTGLVLARSGTKVRFRVNERCDQTRLELGLVRSIS